jgi:hypothetical protein
MKDGRTIAFVLPFDKTMASFYVRAKCLADYAPNGWIFEFIEGEYPIRLNYRVVRAIYRNLYYVISLIRLKFNGKKPLALVIKPNSPLLIFIIRYVLRIAVISDINDPLHLPEFNGYLSTLLIIKSSNRVIFESQEYQDFWGGFSQSTVIEDTPQHECISIDYSKRTKQVIWVGSPATSESLLDFFPHLLSFQEFGFSIKLLGASPSIVQSLLDADIQVLPVYNYNNASLLAELSASMISFVPMPNNDLYNLRGNLKAKISMACGCLTIASRNKMHERLIENQQSGFLFGSYEDFIKILRFIYKDSSSCSQFALNGNMYVANTYTRANHAQEICRVANEIYQ